MAALSDNSLRLSGKITSKLGKDIRASDWLKVVTWPPFRGVIGYYNGPDLNVTAPDKIRNLIVVKMRSGSKRLLKCRSFLRSL